MYCEALPCTVGILCWINLVPGPEKDRELGTRLLRPGNKVRSIHDVDEDKKLMTKVSLRLHVLTSVCRIADCF